MSRSSKKGPNIDPRLSKKVSLANEKNQKRIIKTWSRSCVISPEFVGHTFGVHNGKDHIPVFVTEEMVGYRLGEFAPTRKFKGHGGKLAKATEGGAPSGSGSSQTGSAPSAAPAAAASGPKK